MIFIRLDLFLDLVDWDVIIKKTKKRGGGPIPRKSLPLSANEAIIARPRQIGASAIAELAFFL